MKGIESDKIIFDEVDSFHDPFISDKSCPNKSPEEHLLGEFPMSCYPCHIYADS